MRHVYFGGRNLLLPLIPKHCVYSSKAMQTSKIKRRQEIKEFFLLCFSFKMGSSNVYLAEGERFICFSSCTNFFCPEPFTKPSPHTRCKTQALMRSTF